MASSAVRLNVSRTGSAKWGRPRSVQVQHPVMNRSLDIDLTVTGTPTPGLQQCSSRLIQWPPPSEVYEKPRSSIQKHRLPRATVWRTDHELVQLVKERLTQGLEGVRQMFKARDPFGDSIVTPEGLFQIVKALVGPISRDQYNSFLKAICLHWRSSISFDEFIVRFSDNPTVAKYSMSEVLRKEREARPVNIEENLRNTSMLEWCPFISAPHAFVVFRKRLQKGKFLTFDHKILGKRPRGRPRKRWEEEVEEDLKRRNLTLASARKKCMDRDDWKSETNVRDIFPLSCFVNDGRIIQPQLRDALATIGIHLTDKEFDNLWLKFDSDSNGALPLKRFYKALDLSPIGLPKSDPRSVRSAHATRKSYSKESKAVEKHSKTEVQVSTLKRANTSYSLSKVDSFDLLDDAAIVIGHNGIETQKTAASHRKQTSETKKTTQEVETTTTTKTTTRTTTEKESKEEHLIANDKVTTRVKSRPEHRDANSMFDNVMDHLYFKFEESYRSLMAAFQLFDFMNDGYVSRIDFRRVLREFGFNVNAIDLDAFLHRANIAVVQGLINYRQFLQRFQSKSDSSLAAQAVVRKENSFAETRRIETEETLRAEETEANVCDFFHSDYLRLLSLLREKDRDNTGVVPAHELRDVINSVLKINMTDRQFDEVVERLNYKSNNGAPSINYSNFLELFDAEPGKWNLKKDGQFTAQKYRLGELAPGTPFLRLQDKAKTWMAPPGNKDAPPPSRVEEVRQQLIRLFRDRFHVFDKNFQDMDRKKTSHMSKWQFGALTKLCGITLSVHDLDHLWATLDTEADYTLSYSTLVKTFCGVKQQQKSASVHSMRAQSQASIARDVRPSEQKPKVLIVEQPRVETGSAKERKLNYLLSKVKDDVLKRWDVLHSVFLNLDRDGYSTVSVQDMRDVSQKMKLALTVKERDELINFFDLKANGWFYYLSFLMAVKKFQPQNQISPYVFDIHTKRLNRKAGPTSMALTLHDLLTEMKNILLKKHKTLRKSFKCIDLNHNGFIEECELKKGLKELGYHLCDQDFSDLFQVFDTTHAHRLSYDDFKNTLLTL